MSRYTVTVQEINGPERANIRVEADSREAAAAQATAHAARMIRRMNAAASPTGPYQAVTIRKIGR